MKAAIQGRAKWARIGEWLWLMLSVGSLTIGWQMLKNSRIEAFEALTVMLGGAISTAVIIERQSRRQAQHEAKRAEILERARRAREAGREPVPAQDPRPRIEP